MAKIDIDVAEEFPTLPHAPSVEAIIDIRATPASRPDEKSLRSYAEKSFSGYQFLDSQKEIQFQVVPAGNRQSSPTSREGWKGLRFQSTDKSYIVQFNRDGFVLRRLKPYQSWFQFRSEATRLWNGYAEFIKPTQIFRVGLRYVNLIQMPSGERQFSDYIEMTPVAPRDLDLPISGFMHQDTFTVPGYPYLVNVIKTIRPPNPLSGSGYDLVLDIDVATTVTFELDDSKLSNHLAEMRWLKNKVFFGAIKPKSKRMFD